MDIEESPAETALLPPAVRNSPEPPTAKPSVTNATEAPPRQQESRYGQFSPVIPSRFEETPEETNRNTPGFFDAVGTAIESEWIGPSVYRMMGRESFAPDLSFRFTDDVMKELTDGLPNHGQDHLDDLLDAHSLDHARDIRRRLDDSLQREQALARWGWTGVGLRMGAAILDPVAIGATVASEGWLGPFIYANKISRAGRMLRAGLFAGTLNAGVEAIIALDDPNRDASDVIIAGGLGVITGGAVGAFMPPRGPGDAALKAIDQSLGKMGQRAEVQAMRGMGLDLTPHGRAVYGLTEAEEQAAAKVADDLFVSEWGPNVPGSAADPRAARVAPGDEISRLSFQPDKATPKRGLFARARFGITSFLKGSDDPDVRRLGNVLAEDVLGEADGRPSVGMAATEWSEREMNIRRIPFYRVVKREFHAWRKANRVPWWRIGAFDEFMEEVGHAVRRGDVIPDNPHVKAIADQFRKQAAEMLSFGKRAGLRGFEDVAENTSYLPRIYSQVAIDRAIASHGREAVEGLIRGAIVSGGSIEAETADRLAKSLLTRIRQRRYGLADSDIAHLGIDNLESLARGLKDQGLDDDAIDALLFSPRQRLQSNAGRISRAKHRLPVDETYVDPTTGLSFEDLLENNGAILFDLYSKQLTGAAALKRVTDAFAEVKVVDGVEVREELSFDALLNRIRRNAEQSGRDASRVKRELEAVELVRKSIMGIPVNDPDNALWKWADRIRDFNFIRVMGQAGVAQAVETANLLGAAGVRTMAAHMPELRNLIRRAKDGQLADDLVEELINATGLGEDRIIAHLSRRTDDVLMTSEVVEGTDRLLNAGKQIVADLGGIRPMTMMLERMALKVLSNRLVKEALEGVTMNPRRLAMIGLTPEDFAVIAEQIKRYAAVEPSSVAGVKLRRLNLDQWADQEAAAKLVVGVSKWTRQVIQRNDIGQMAAWMSNPAARVMLQFRTFVTAAWEKQTLANLNQWDMQAFTAFSGSVFLGSLLYIAQTSVNSVGRKDADEYLADRLTPKNIALSAIQRAGASSLIPLGIDIRLPQGNRADRQGARAVREGVGSSYQALPRFHPSGSITRSERDAQHAHQPPRPIPA